MIICLVPVNGTVSVLDSYDGYGSMFPRQINKSMVKCLNYIEKHYVCSVVGYTWLRIVDIIAAHLAHS